MGGAQSKECFSTDVLLVGDPAVSSKTKRLDTSEQPCDIKTLIINNIVYIIITKQ